MTQTSKSILITGCSTGIGAYCCTALRDRGWQVYVTARKPEDIEALQAEGYTAFHLDYCDPQSIAKCAQDVRAATSGKLFALFNNGGHAMPGPIEDIPMAAYREQFETNVFGYIDLTQRLLPDMIANGDGRIIIHSSVLGFAPLRWTGAYNGSKFALEGIFATLREELRGTGVYVSLLNTGPVESQINENAQRLGRKWLDLEKSRHGERLAPQLADLHRHKAQGIGRFRLKPDAVCAKLEKALKSARPKSNYYITLPTWLMAIARRLLPISTYVRLIGLLR